MPFDIPRGRILPVHAVDVRLDPAPHPLEADEGDAIEARWLEEKARNPALFDGQVALLSALSYADGRLVGRCHAVRYATFLYWRAQRGAEAEHSYAHAVLVSADNALVAIRMGGHTVNAGRVYFAAGSFEPEDFPGGEVDVDANMRREVLEETGLDLADARAEPSLFLLSRPEGTVIFRRYFARQTADELAARIRRHVAAESEPEIDGPVTIRGPDDLPGGLMPQMPALIDWHFANP